METISVLCSIPGKSEGLEGREHEGTRVADKQDSCICEVFCLRVPFPGIRELRAVPGEGAWRRGCNPSSVGRDGVRLQLPSPFFNF